MAPSHIAKNSQEAASSSAQAEKKKLTHYEVLSHKYIVMPVAMETLGPIAPMGMKFIKEVGSRIKDITGDKRSTVHLFQRLQINIQKGNAAAIAGTLPSAKKLDEIYYL